MGNCLGIGNSGVQCANVIFPDKVFIFSREKKSVASKSLLTLAEIEGWVVDGSAVVVKADHVVPAADEVATEKTTYSESVTGYTPAPNTFSILNPSDRVVNNGVTGLSVAGNYYAYIVSANGVIQGRRGANDAQVFEMSPIRIIKLPKTKGGDGVANKSTYQYSYTDVYGENTLQSTFTPADFSIQDVIELQITDITFVNQNSTIASKIKVIAYDYDQKAVLSGDITTANIVVKDAGGATVTGTWTLAGDVLTFSGTVTAQTYTISGNFVTDRFNLPENVPIVIAS